MKRNSLGSSPLRVLVPLLAVGCSAVQTVQVPMDFLPTHPLDPDHVGVGLPAFDTDGSAESNTYAAQLQGRIKGALTDQPYALVPSEQLDEVSEYMESLSGRLDNVDPEVIDQIVAGYGMERPMTGMFLGTVVANKTEGIKQGLPLTGGGLLANIFDTSVDEDARMEIRYGSASITLNCSFLDMRSRTLQHVRVFTAQSPPIETFAELGVEPPPLEFGPAFEACMNDISSQFARTWTRSTQRHPVPVFVGDGSMHMFWEAGEFQQLENGKAFLEQGNFDKAADAFQTQAASLSTADGEMLARALYDHAYALLCKDELDLALPLFDRANTLAPTNMTIGRGLAFCRERLAQREQLLETEVQP